MALVPVAFVPYNKWAPSPRAHAFSDVNDRSRPMHFLRSLLADLLSVRDESARDGSWWETDLILVLLTGAIVAGALAWLQL